MRIASGKFGKVFLFVIFMLSLLVVTPCSSVRPELLISVLDTVRIYQSGDDVTVRVIWSELAEDTISLEVDSRVFETPVEFSTGSDASGSRDLTLKVKAGAVEGTTTIRVKNAAVTVDDYVDVTISASTVLPNATYTLVPKHPKPGDRVTVRLKLDRASTVPESFTVRTQDSSSSFTIMPGSLEGTANVELDNRQQQSISISWSGSVITSYTRNLFVSTAVDALYKGYQGTLNFPPAKLASFTIKLIRSEIDTSLYIQSAEGLDSKFEISVIQSQPEVLTSSGESTGPNPSVRMTPSGENYFVTFYSLSLNSNNQLVGFMEAYKSGEPTTDYPLVFDPIP